MGALMELLHDGGEEARLRGPWHRMQALSGGSNKQIGELAQVGSRLFLLVSVRES